jgi:hypothetical protein
VRTDGADVRVDTPLSDTPVADIPAADMTPTDVRLDPTVTPDADARAPDADATAPPPADADARAPDADASAPPPVDADATAPPTDVPLDASLCTADNQCPGNKPHCNTQTGACVSVSTLAISPTNPTNAKGTKRQFQATITYSDNSTGAATGVAWASADMTVATIDSAGLASTLKVGTSVITATLGTVSGTTTLAVTDATLSSILVEPGTASIALGTTQAFIATGTFSDNSTQPLTNQVTWTSATTTVAIIGADGIARTATGTATMTGTSVITATFDRGDAGAPVTGTATLTVTTATLVSLAITPGVPTSIPRFTQVRFVATGTFSDGTTQNLTTQVNWTSSDQSVATISNLLGSEGYATGIGAGMSTITATHAGGLSKNMVLTVTGASLLSLSISPANSTIANGLVVIFTATGNYSDNSSRDLTTLVTWTSSDIGKAVISNTPGSQGVATTVSPGPTTITATLGTVSTTTLLTVNNATLVSIAITPDTPSLAKGTTLRLTATGTYTDQTTQPITTQVTWGSSAGGVATISNNPGNPPTTPSTQGVVSGLTPGMTNITAALDNKIATVILTVNDAALVSIGVTPPNPKIALNTDKQFTAIGTYTDNTTQVLTGAVTWNTTDDTIATIDNVTNKGLAHGVKAGVVNVSATFVPPGLPAVVGITGLEVTGKALVRIQVDSAASSLANGTTLKLTATGYYTDNSFDDLTELASWSTSNGSIASVSNEVGKHGEVTGNSVGSATITAYYNGVNGFKDLNVTPATLVSIAVAPINATIAVGSTKQFIAIGTYTDGTVQIITSTVFWQESTAGVVASISNDTTVNNDIGLAKGLTEGTAFIYASFGVGPGTITGAATLRVIPKALTRIDVTPTDRDLPIGLKTQYHATGLYTNGDYLDITGDVSWSSSQTNFATVSNALGSKGEVTPVAVGRTTIIAQMGSVSGSTPLDVINVVVSSVAVTPNPMPDPLSVAKGSTVQYQAIATYSDNSTADVTGQATWASSGAAAPTTVTITSPGGLATAVDMTSSPVTITATFDSHSGTAMLSVTDAVLQTITIGSPTIARGTTYQFTAMGHFSDNTDQVLNVNQISWGSITPTVASISNAAGSKGLASGVSPGTTTITAFLSGITGTGTLTVSAATLNSISVTPTGGNPLPVGNTAQYTAVGTYSDNSTQNITNLVVWTSSMPTIASISMAPGSIGLATALAPGATTMSATFTPTTPPGPPVVGSAALNVQ